MVGGYKARIAADLNVKFWCSVVHAWGCRASACHFAKFLPVIDVECPLSSVLARLHAALLAARTGFNVSSLLVPYCLLLSAEAAT